jgi:hypothetical protein
MCTNGVYTIWDLTNDLKASRTVKKKKITHNRPLMELFVKPPPLRNQREGGLAPYPNLMRTQFSSSLYFPLFFWLLVMNAYRTSRETLG